MAENENYLDSAGAVGFEDMTPQEVTTPRLLVAQQNSGVVQEEKVPIGHYYHSLTGKDYGDCIKAAVIKFQRSWTVWRPNGGGFVKQCPVGSIPTTGDPWAMKDPEGNDVRDTWNYLLILMDHLEDGPILYSSTPGNMTYLRAWNSAMYNQRTVSGKRLPIFGGIWELPINKDKNKKGQIFYSNNVGGKCGIRFAGYLPEDIFRSHVEGAFQSAQQVTLGSSEPPAIENQPEDQVNF